MKFVTENYNQNSYLVHIIYSVFQQLQTWLLADSEVVSDRSNTCQIPPISKYTNIIRAN
jgi:hypothetical protein